MSDKVKWDQYFMTLAYIISRKSKDPSTNVGSIIVGPDKEIRSTGYNGLPRKIQDKKERYINKEYKYFSANHAEENAILHCARIGVSAKGCTLYTTWIPCARCAKAIIQAGIIEVIYDNNFPGNKIENQNNWIESMKISKELLLEADIVLRGFSGKLLKVRGLYQGIKYLPEVE